MPNNPRKEARVAKREARQDEKRTADQKKKYDSFVKQGDKEKMKLEKKYSPTQIRQIIDETPAGMRTPWMNSYKAPSTMKKGGVAKYQTGGTAKAGLGSPKAKIAAASKAMKGMKPAASKVGKTGTGAAKKFQTGGTPFQEYMKTPGAVASDTVMKTVSPDMPELQGGPGYWNAAKKPVAKNPNNQNLLEKVYEKTYGQGWRGDSGQPAKGETFEQYKRRMGPLRQKGGATKATYKTGGMVNPNAKVSKQTKPGSKGVKSGVNPKATAAKRATGRTGGTSTAPKGALPKAQMGTQVGKKDYMKPTPIDSTLTKKDVKRVFKTIKKRKN